MDNLIKPEQPYLELGFYIVTETPKLAFRDFVNSLRKLDATLLNQILILKGSNIEKLPRLVITPKPDQRLGIITFDVAEFEELFTSPDTYPVTAYLNNITRLVSTDIGEMVTHVIIGKDDEERDHHPFEIITEYGIFETWEPNQPELSPEVSAANKVLIERFFQIIEETHPAYATITTGEPIYSPTAMAETLGGTNFKNFYIQQAFIGTSAFEHIIERYRELDASITLLEEGAYISTTAIFNLEHRQVENSQQRIDCMELVALAIAEVYARSVDKKK